MNTLGSHNVPLPGDVVEEPEGAPVSGVIYRKFHAIKFGVCSSLAPNGIIRISTRTCMLAMGAVTMLVCLRRVRQEEGEQDG